MNHYFASQAATLDTAARAAFEEHYQRTRRLSGVPERDGAGYRDDAVQAAWNDWQGGVSLVSGMSSQVLADANRYQAIKKYALSRIMAGYDGPVLQWTLRIPASDLDQGSLDSAVSEMSKVNGDQPHYSSTGVYHTMVMGVTRKGKDVFSFGRESYMAQLRKEQAGLCDKSLADGAQQSNAEPAEHKAQGASVFIADCHNMLALGPWGAFAKLPGGLAYQEAILRNPAVNVFFTLKAPACQGNADAPASVPVPGGRFEEVGKVWLERVNQDFNAILDEDRVRDGEKLFRFVPASCAECKSTGFKQSSTGVGCTFCDGTEGGAGPDTPQ